MIKPSNEWSLNFSSMFTVHEHINLIKTLL